MSRSRTDSGDHSNGDDPWRSVKAPCSRTSTSRSRQAPSSRAASSTKPARRSPRVRLARPPPVHRWRQAISRAERRLHGRPRGVPDLRRAARRLRDRREFRHDGPRLERSPAVRANLLPRDPGRERGATGHRRALGRSCPGSRLRLPARLRPLSGASSDPPAEASPGPFTFVIAREIGDPQAYGQPATALATSDGSFAIAGLLPGTYLVEARSTSGSEFASKEVVVDGSDVAGVTLLLSKGATARGRIRFDTDDPPKALRPSRGLRDADLVDHQMRRMRA